MFECYHCLSRSVIWDCDYDADDFGYDVDGIVQIFHCAECGAEIEYLIPFDKPEDNE